MSPTPPAPMGSEVITSCVVEHLRNVLGSTKVGDHELPSKNPPMPHCIVYYGTAGRGRGSFDNPEEDRDHLFRVKQVGRGREQVQWMSDRVVEAMTKMEIDIATLSGGAMEGNVHWVEVDSIGSIVTTGDILMESTNTYRVRAGK